MKIYVLMENTVGESGCLNEHGLSVYVEMSDGKRKLLIDTGASAQFAQNAEKLGVNLADVDTMILSHGHYDHSGGMLKFRELNEKAEIYMQEKATGAYYHVEPDDLRFIGIDPEILKMDKVHLMNGGYKLGDDVEVFTGHSGRRPMFAGNRLLQKKVGEPDKFVQDVFDHEEYVVLSEGDKKVLISGCAHNGIANIMDRFVELYGQEPDVVISGFHMMKKKAYTEEELELIDSVGGEMKKMRTRFYTGHCTGETAYARLKEVLGDKLVYAHSGDVFTV